LASAKLRARIEPRGAARRIASLAMTAADCDLFLQFYDTRPIEMIGFFPLGSFWQFVSAGS
jgi:hypothetical protein